MKNKFLRSTYIINLFKLSKFNLAIMKADIKWNIKLIKSLINHKYNAYMRDEKIVL